MTVNSNPSFLSHAGWKILKIAGAQFFSPSVHASQADLMDTLTHDTMPHVRECKFYFKRT
jgi:hypothetical protein